MEAPEGMDKEEENVYSKLKDPAEDVYHLASLVKQPQKQRTSTCFELHWFFFFGHRHSLCLV